MFNTWGIRSINSGSFVYSASNDIENESLSKKRNFIITSLRIANLVLNILGYTPSLSIYSGIFRILMSAFIFTTSHVIKKFTSPQNKNINNWVIEAIDMAKAQLLRGSLEAVMPFGHIINYYIDGLASFKNLAEEALTQFLPPSLLSKPDKKNMHDPNYNEYMLCLRLS
jgi:hypothetical protein